MDAFSVLDKNQDRLISLHELNGVLEALGLTPSDLSQLDHLADQVDSHSTNKNTHRAQTSANAKI